MVFRLFTVVLILTDVTLVIVDVTMEHHDDTADAIEIVSRVIVGYFLFEIALRIFAKG